MNQLIFVPLEIIEERYSAQWLNWFLNELDKRSFATKTITPSVTPRPIEHGQFLDVVKTNTFKAQQLQQICQLFEQNSITDQTTFLFMDAWFPGLEMLAYIRDALKIKFKIVGMLHAGTWDQHDYLSQCQMTPWAEHVEKSWLEIMDAVCVATEFHKGLIIENRAHYWDEQVSLEKKIHVTGFPIYPDFVKPTDKKPIILFPHRKAPEKNPQRFHKLAAHSLDSYKELKSFSAFATKDYLNWSTFDETERKKLYYQLLNQSRFAVSFADQETWGIAMLEAVLCGCFPIVPDRLSYSELYPCCFKFSSTQDDQEIGAALERIVAILRDPDYHTQQLQQLQDKIIDSGITAIPHILDLCEKLHD